jgi:hypothetical protein
MDTQLDGLAARCIIAHILLSQIGSISATFITPQNRKSVLLWIAELTLRMATAHAIMLLNGKWRSYGKRGVRRSSNYSAG